MYRLRARPGLTVQFLELFQRCVEYVEANEKDYVHRYEMHKGIKDNHGKVQYVVLEG